MHGSTFEGPVSLNSAKITGGASLQNGATFKGELDLAHATIGGSLEMHGSTFERRASLIGISITKDLDLSDGDLHDEVNLTGATIGGELRLGSSDRPPPRWKPEASLVLRNAQCGALQDRRGADRDAWPARLDLEGFTYLKLGGLGGGGSEADMLARRTRSYLDLLERDRTSSPRPYEYLAQVFRQGGRPDKANAILYAARERRRKGLLAQANRYGPRLERLRSWGARRMRWLGMTLLKWTIGYGIGGRYFLVLIWVGCLTMIGALLLWQYGTQAEKNFLPLMFVSLDELLPVILLDKAHEAVLSGATPAADAASGRHAVAGGPASAAPNPQPFWLMAYFHAHKIAGWVLGSFLVAGLAGLTQRS